MTHYQSWPISQLPYQVGSDEGPENRIARNVEGFVSYGPYLSLAPGRYFGGFYIRTLEATESSELLRLSICAGENVDVLGERFVLSRELYSSIAGLVGINFTIENETSLVEVRLHVSACAAIEVQRLVIFRNERI